MSATKGGILHEQGMRVLPENPESLPFYQAPEEAASGEAAKAEILELLKSRNKSYGSRNRARPTRRRQLRKLQSGVILSVLSSTCCCVSGESTGEVHDFVE